MLSSCRIKIAKDYFFCDFLNFVFLFYLILIVLYLTEFFIIFLKKKLNYENEGFFHFIILREKTISSPMGRYILIKKNNL